MIYCEGNIVLKNGRVLRGILYEDTEKIPEKELRFIDLNDMRLLLIRRNQIRDTNFWGGKKYTEGQVEDFLQTMRIAYGSKWRRIHV